MTTLNDIIKAELKRARARLRHYETTSTQYVEVKARQQGAAEATRRAIEALEKIKQRAEGTL